MRELPVRKPLRLKEFNYSQTGRYFITICVKGRHEMLGRIVVGDAAFGVPSVKLTEIGLVVKKRIEHINGMSDGYCLDNYVIMPHHPQ